MLRTESDSKLVAQTRKGNVEAFNCLISRWQNRLFNYVLCITGNKEDALDLCQETFLMAYQSIHQLRDVTKFPGWLFRIAHNLTYSHLRQHLHLEGLEKVPGLDSSLGGSNSSDDTEGPYRNLKSPGPSVLSMEMKFSVREALDLLTLEQRVAIILKIYHGFRFDEISEILSCPVSTVKSRIYAGFTRLRGLLAASPAKPKLIVRQRKPQSG